MDKQSVKEGLPVKYRLSAYLPLAFISTIAAFPSGVWLISLNRCSISSSNISEGLFPVAILITSALFAATYFTVMVLNPFGGMIRGTVYMYKRVTVLLVGFAMETISKLP